MAKAGQGGLEGIAAGLTRENKGPPPVERWNPPFCGGNYASSTSITRIKTTT
jgi:hypothetical protein